jgi:hypothetical protein
MCYKNVSNFAPNKERLFSIFPNMSHSSSQWVPIYMHNFGLVYQGKDIVSRFIIGYSN